MRPINITFFALSLLFLSGSALQSHAQAYVVIVNKSNPSATLSAGQIKLLYLRKVKRIWADTNKPIKPVDIKGNGALRTAFLAKVISMSSAEVEQYFKQRQFANSETLPAEFSTEEQVIAFVAENDGAIGFVSDEAYNSAKDKVKVICKF